MEDENIEVPSSEESGNVPIDFEEETPSEETPTVEETETTEEVEKPEEKLYELPDGRKVDGETLSKEWKENFLPDYTRKSQALAAKEPQTINETPQKPYENPEWEPKSYQEVIQIAKQEALNEIEAKETAKIEQRQALESQVTSQLDEIKAIDKNLDENALFLHANKYGFRDLKVAHQNMKDMSEMAKKVQLQTAENIAKRNDPVSVSPGATGAKPDPGAFENAVGYLRSLNG